MDSIPITPQLTDAHGFLTFAIYLNYQFKFEKKLSLINSEIHPKRRLRLSQMNSIY